MRTQHKAASFEREKLWLLAPKTLKINLLRVKTGLSEIFLSYYGKQDQIASDSKFFDTTFSLIVLNARTDFLRRGWMKNIRGNFGVLSFQVKKFIYYRKYLAIPCNIFQGSKSANGETVNGFIENNE